MALHEEIKHIGGGHLIGVTGKMDYYLSDEKVDAIIAKVREHDAADTSGLEADRAFERAKVKAECKAALEEIIALCREAAEEAVDRLNPDKAYGTGFDPATQMKTQVKQAIKEALK